MGLVSLNEYNHLSEDKILESWETPVQIYQTSLRPVQKSALLKCLEYDINEDLEPAIINMPTGTGKTGVIASILFKSIFKRTLIIVPSNALRIQISNDLLNINKYISWKILPSCSKKPLIARLEPNNIDKLNLSDLSKYFTVIATPNILQSIQKYGNTNEFLSKFDRLIFDEAHHCEAPTWSLFRDNFIKREKKIFQFTATPYRNDGKKLEGSLIFQYSIQKAFEAKFFEKIHFEGITEYYENESDVRIAKRALEILQKDLDNNLNHVLMVKTNTIKHAKELKEIYENLIANFTISPNILLATSRDELTKEEKLLLQNVECRIVICVDMFGEGYDLPNLKILALHRKCKSLPIFMQLIGRFTRTSLDIKLGTATIVANTASDDINEQFQELFSRDADWNLLLGNLGQERMEKEFFSSSIDSKYCHELIRKLFSSNSLNIKSSAIIYKNIKFTIQNLFDSTDFIKYFNSISEKNYLSAIFPQENLGIILTRQKAMPAWVSSDELTFDLFNLYVFYRKNDDLFIHGSDKDAILNFGKKMCFTNHSFPDLYRVFHDLNRSAFANVGMLALSRDLRFRMYTGSDVFRQLNQIDINNNGVSNLFGHGFINGKKASIGCSIKGTVWSMATVNIFEWMKWCNSLNEKINNDEIDIKKFAKNMLEPFSVSNLDDYKTLIISPIDLLTKTKNIQRINATTANQEKIFVEFYETNFNKQINGEILFDLKIFFSNNSYCLFKFIYTLSEGFTLDSKIMNGINIDLSDNELEHIAYSLELVIWTNKFEVISMNDKYGYRAEYTYQLESQYVSQIDWSGVDINKESWKYGEVTNSVQGRIIDLLLVKNPPQILFYDDGSNELADLVAFWFDEDNEKLLMKLYHCKYAIGKKSDIAAITELTQQTLSTCDKLVDPLKALKQLKHRENTASKKNKSRFIVGEMADLDALIRRYKFYELKIEIYLVQPSLDYPKLSSRINSVLGQLACINMQTLQAQTYFYIS